MSDDIRDLIKTDPREPFTDEDIRESERDRLIEETVTCANCGREYSKLKAQQWVCDPDEIVEDCPACTCWECGNKFKDGHAPGCAAVE